MTLSYIASPDFSVDCGFKGHTLDLLCAWMCARGESRLVKSRRDKIAITRHTMMHQVLYIVQLPNEEGDMHIN